MGVDGVSISEARRPARPAPAPLTRTTSASVTGSTSSPARICSGAASTSSSTSRSCTGGTRVIAAIRQRSGSQTGASRGTRPARSATVGGDATTTSPSAWVFLINGLVYVVWNLYSSHFRNRMWPARDERSGCARARRAARSSALAITQAHRQRQLWHAAEDVVSHSDLRVRAAHDPDRHCAVTRLYRGDAGAAGSVRRPSDRRGRFTPSARWRWCCSSVVHVLEIAAAGFFVKVRSMITGK